MKIIVKSPHSWPKIVIHSNPCIILNINYNIWPTPMGGFNSLRLPDACMHQYLLTLIDSDNGLWPGQHQAIIWTNAGILLIGLEKKLQWNLNQNSNILIQENSKVSSAKWSQPQCVKLFCENHFLQPFQTEWWHSFSGWMAPWSLHFLILDWVWFNRLEPSVKFD